MSSKIKLSSFEFWISFLTISLGVAYIVEKFVPSKIDSWLDIVVGGAAVIIGIIMVGVWAILLDRQGGD